MRWQGRRGGGEREGAGRVSWQAAMWTTAALASALAVAAALADRRRSARRDLDSPGWVPWTLIQVLAMIVSALAAAYALKA